jgi:hypothetical protein
LILLIVFFPQNLRRFRPALSLLPVATASKWRLLFGSSQLFAWFLISLTNPVDRFFQT